MGNSWAWAVVPVCKWRFWEEALVYNRRIWKPIMWDVKRKQKMTNFPTKILKVPDLDSTSPDHLWTPIGPIDPKYPLV